MENLGYYNGNYGPLEEMMVPMNDRASYFGDGVYDATYSRNGVILLLTNILTVFITAQGCSESRFLTRKKNLKLF